MSNAILARSTGQEGFSLQLSIIHSALLAAATPLAGIPADEQAIEVQADGTEQTQELLQVSAGEIAPLASPETSETAEPSTDPVTTDGGDVITVVGGKIDTPGDPLEQLNATSYELTDAVDQALVEPVAEIYENVLPDPIRLVLRNFLRNLLEPVNFINGLLQLRPDLAVEALGRFAVNSTLGFGGVLDVAAEKPFTMEFRRNGFANTMGRYGVGSGPFLVLPLLGVTSLRDLVGNTIDQAIVPFVVGPPLNTSAYGIPAYVIGSLEFRLAIAERVDAVRVTDDPYALTREHYLCMREADIADLRRLAPPRDCAIPALVAALQDAQSVGDRADSQAANPAP